MALVATTGPGSASLPTGCMSFRAERSATPTALDDVLLDLDHVGRVTVDIMAKPSEIFKVLRQVSLFEMPLGRLLGSMPYLP